MRKQQAEAKMQMDLEEIRMEAFSGIDLQAALRARGMTVADLAERVPYDASTISRYMSKKLTPDPDTIYLIAMALGDPDIFRRWMRTLWPDSYGRMHPATVELPMPGAVMTLYAEMEDVNQLMTAFMRDAADGRLDDPGLRDRVKTQVGELVSAGQQIMRLLEKEEK